MRTNLMKIDLNDLDLLSIFNISLKDNFSSFLEEELMGEIRKLNKLMGNNSKLYDLTICSNSKTCENSNFHRILLGYCYPLVLVLCLIGNGANVFTYSGHLWRKSTTVKMLSVKAVMNTVFMIFIWPHFFLIVFGGNEKSVQLEIAIWMSWPYMLFVANFAGTCATWLTVFMTFETYVFVSFPTYSKKWCTTKNFAKVLFVILLVSFCLHIQIPFTRYVQSLPCTANVNGDYGKKLQHKMYVRNETIYINWEYAHYWANLILALAAPNAVLVGFTAKLICKLTNAVSLPRYSESKLCVVRITMATTCCQLLLETPTVVDFVLATVYGSSFVNKNPAMCACHVITNFNTQLNASICFFIYFLCSSKFRELLIKRLTCASTVTSSGERRLARSRTSFDSQQICNNHFPSPYAPLPQVERL